MKKNIMIFFLVCLVPMLFALDLAKTDTEISLNLSGTGNDPYKGDYNLKFTDGNSVEKETVNLTTATADGELKGTGEVWLEWTFFSPVAVKVSVYAEPLSGVGQTLDWSAIATHDDADDESKASFEQNVVVGYDNTNNDNKYGSEDDPIKIFSYDPSLLGLKDAGKVKFSITTEDASSLRPDSFSATLTAVVTADDTASSAP